MAAEEYGFKKIVLAGGVSANSGLRARVEKDCAERGYRFFAPPLSLCGDNAAMIASAAYYQFLGGCEAAPLTLNADPSLELISDAQA